MNNKELGIINDNGVVEPFRSSELRICLYCGIPITEENSSGWERFTKTIGLTCPTCKDCEYVVNSRCPNCGWEGCGDQECGVSKYYGSIIPEKIEGKVLPESSGKYCSYKYDRCPKCDAICEDIILSEKSIPVNEIN